MAERAADELRGGGDEIIDTYHKGEMSDVEKRLAARSFHIIERLLLILVALMTVGAVAHEVAEMFRTQEVTLGDILMMFLYTEVIGMVAVFYTGRASTFVYPIFIAITALARLVILQGKDMKPENIVFEASAVLLLTVAAVLIVRVGRS